MSTIRFVVAHGVSSLRIKCCISNILYFCVIERMRLYSQGVPNSEIELAVSKYAYVHVVSTCSIKGHGQMLTRAILHVTAYCPAKKGTFFLKSVRIEHRHSDFD